MTFVFPSFTYGLLFMQLTFQVSVDIMALVITMSGLEADMGIQATAKIVRRSSKIHATARPLW